MFIVATNVRSSVSLMGGLALLVFAWTLMRWYWILISRGKPDPRTLTQKLSLLVEGTCHSIKAQPLKGRSH